MNCDYLIVGAGFYGSVMAERIANDLGKSVLIIDQRGHIGGNCHSQRDRDTGIEYHTYGTHFFHTSSETVWEYISRFTAFNQYRHQVLTTHKGRVYQMPINLETINAYFGRNFRPAEAKEFLKQMIERDRIEAPANLEEKCVSLIGRPLYEAFIKGYTVKQWGKDPKELPADIINRLPVRFNYEESYYHDARWQGIPLDGYTAVFETMLKSPRITVRLNCDYFKHRDEFEVREKIIYTGPLDRYFDYCCGPLEWRVIDCRREVVPEEDYQGVAQMNFADIEVPYLRIHEPRHLHPERSYDPQATVIFYETSQHSAMKEGYYPINTPHNQKVLNEYKAMAKKQVHLIVGGRLGNYIYNDMDKTILSALNCYQKEIKEPNGLP